jgi:hypothetical protein
VRHARLEHVGVGAILDRQRDERRPHLLVRAHTLDGDPAMEPFRASDVGQEHVGLAGGPDRTGYLVALGS